MRPSDRFHLHRDAIRALILAHRVQNPRVFGSVARGEDREGSDLDILVDPMPHTSLLDLGEIQMDLHELLGVEVDVLTPNALPEAFRDEVLREAIAI